MSKSEPSYQQNVAGILRHRDGKILVAERVGLREAWQFPQGGVDAGESAEQALVRELGEEISLEPGDFRIVQKRGGYRYLFPAGKRRGHDGKDQTYFLCDFLSADARINVATAHPEFRAWKWIEPAGFQKSWLPKMKLEVYSAVFRDFFGVRL